MATGDPSVFDSRYAAGWDFAALGAGSATVTATVVTYTTSSAVYVGGGLPVTGSLSWNDNTTWGVAPMESVPVEPAQVREVAKALDAAVESAFWSGISGVRVIDQPSELDRAAAELGLSVDEAAARLRALLAADAAAESVGRHRRRILVR